jgi:hypothetical protein
VPRSDASLLQSNRPPGRRSLPGVQRFLGEGIRDDKSDGNLSDITRREDLNGYEFGTNYRRQLPDHDNADDAGTTLALMVPRATMALRLAQTETNRMIVGVISLFSWIV